jgi:hypothetical protein
MAAPEAKEVFRDAFRDACSLLNQGRDAAEVAADACGVDPAFEFRAPQFCDFVRGEQYREDAYDDDWFYEAHANHEPRSPPPPGRPLIQLTPSPQQHAPVHAQPSPARSPAAATQRGTPTARLLKFGSAQRVHSPAPAAAAAPRANQAARQLQFGSPQVAVAAAAAAAQRARSKSAASSVMDTSAEGDDSLHRSIDRSLGALSAAGSATLSPARTNNSSGVHDPSEDDDLADMLARHNQGVQRSRAEAAARRAQVAARALKASRPAPKPQPQPSQKRAVERKPESPTVVARFAKRGRQHRGEGVHGSGEKEKENGPVIELDEEAKALLEQHNTRTIEAAIDGDIQRLLAEHNSRAVAGPKPAAPLAEPVRVQRDLQDELRKQARAAAAAERAKPATQPAAVAFTRHERPPAAVAKPKPALRPARPTAPKGALQPERAQPPVRAAAPSVGAAPSFSSSSSSSSSSSASHSSSSPPSSSSSSSSSLAASSQVAALSERLAASSLQAGGDAHDAAELIAMLRAHNKQFRKVAYEPRAHSVADIRRWETTTGKKWYDLGPEEREAANAQIAHMKTQA